FKRPFSSAPCIICAAALSFTLPAGLRYSSFAAILAASPYFFSILTISISGVEPIICVKFFFIFSIISPSLIFTLILLSDSQLVNTAARRGHCLYLLLCLLYFRCL